MPNGKETRKTARHSAARVFEAVAGAGAVTSAIVPAYSRGRAMVFCAWYLPFLSA